MFILWHDTVRRPLQPLYDGIQYIYMTSSLDIEYPTTYRTPSLDIGHLISI